MKLKNALLVVKDIDKSVAFYHDVLGLRVIMDFGENKTLTGGLVLQTEASYHQFIKRDITFQANDAEIYFEEDDYDSFLKKIASLNIDYVHPSYEHAWGQRVVRFYDPDKHIIEVGENIKIVCQRFLKSGMSEEDVAKRMAVPMSFIKMCKR